MRRPRDKSAAVDARFYARHARTFTVTTSLTTRGRGFAVTDAAGGAAAMQVETAHFGGYHRLRSLLFLDASRRALLAVEESPYVFRSGRRWEAFRARGRGQADLLFVAVDKTPLLTFSTTTVHVFLDGSSSNNNERAADFVVHGSYHGGTMRVAECGGATVAQIGKTTTVWGALVGEHTYTVRVYPDIDQVFILALTVILDQIHNPDYDRRCYHHSCPNRY